MPASIDPCWRRVGVAGDRRCPELAAMGHCRNCSRYADIAAEMLNRMPPEGHVEQATELLAGCEEAELGQTLAVIVFRLADEWLALPAEVFEEVSPLRPIRTIPHRAVGVLLGLVNVRGSLELCVSLASLLGVERAETFEPSAVGASPRLMVIVREGSRWTFAVNEVCGIHRIPPQSLLEVPTTAARIRGGLAKAIFAWRDTHAGLLDDSRLFAALGRSIQ